MRYATDLPGGTLLIKAVKGTRDILPPSSAVWNHVEAVARARFPRLQLPRNPHADLRGDRAVRARRRRRHRHRQQRDVHVGGPRRHLADAAAGEHRVASSAPTSSIGWTSGRDWQKLYYIGPMFRRERPQKGRYRQFFQIGAEAIGVGIARRRCRSDRDGGRDPAQARDCRTFSC